MKKYGTGQVLRDEGDEAPETSGLDAERREAIEREGDEGTDD